MNDEIQTFDNIISLVGDINKKNIVIKTVLFDDVNELSNTFINIYKKEKNQLPYHINIMDLLKANEIEHSRIIAELLKQNNSNRFEILESFYNNCLQKINSNFDKNPIKPEISSETERIDLRILDIDYAIIIENKIHGAPDQPDQLARYIDKVKNCKEESQIWVVYLTRYGTEPDNQSWGDYKEDFEERFFKMSFRYDILPWLKDDVLPNCKIKDVYLKSTIEQYIVSIREPSKILHISA